jgi:site-specific DNA-methyltransferase (adenine-specific)
MIKPYYEHAGITLYHGDCREILPTLADNSFDLVLTDPPYPNLKGGTEHKLPGVAKRRNKSVTVGVPWDTSLDWCPEAERVARLGLVVFCSFACVSEVATAFRSQRVGLVTWYKRNSPLPMNNVPRYDTEFAWLFKKTPGLGWRRIKSMMIDWPMITSGCVEGEEKKFHPTQKPLPVVRKLIPDRTASILDPFMGSGTTLRAAKDLGIPATGIDENERYCEVAANRLAQEVFQFAEADGR